MATEHDEEGGSRLWRGMRTLIFGEDHEATLRDKLEGIPKLAMVRFGAADVVRHPLVGRIVEAYEGPDSGRPRG